MHIVTIGKEFHFDAAHRLDHHEGACRFMHGHTYTLTLELTGALKDTDHFLVDFHHLKEELAGIIEEMDHNVLNNVFVDTTVEHMVIALAVRVLRIYPHLGVSVQLREGLGGYARYNIPYKGTEVV